MFVLYFRICYHEQGCVKYSIINNNNIVGILWIYSTRTKISLSRKVSIFKENDPLNNLIIFFHCTISYFYTSLRKESIFPCKCLKGSDIGLYVHCENSNLASLSVAFKNLVTSQSPIEELIITKSHIRKSSFISNSGVWFY